MANPNNLARKLEGLSPEQLAEVEDFVDFISERAQDRLIARAAAGASEPALEKIWNNPEDDAYDAL